jgi:HK97 family phage portal protein
LSLISRIARPQASATTSGELERLIRSVYGGGITATGLTVNSDNAMRVGAVFACVLVLAQSVAQLPIHLYEQQGKKKERAAGHSLYSLIHDQPNEWMTSYEMKQLVMVHLLLRGNSVWIKTRGSDGRIRELIPIHPNLIEGIKQDELYRLFYRIKRPSTQAVDEIPGDRLVHFRGLSMNGFSGMNPIEYAREMIGLSMAAEKHGAKLFANGARLGGILTYPGKLKQQAAENLINSFNEKHASVEQAHKTMLLEEGAKWEKVSMTNNDAQFLESRKYQRSEIAGFYRVPPHMIGDLDKATFSNIEHQDLGFVKHALMPWLVGMEMTLKKDLMTAEEKRRLYFKFNIEGLLRGDIKSRNDAHKVAIDGGWLNPNEIREMEDRNPYEGGNVYRVPMNTEPAGGAANEPE